MNSTEAKMGGAFSEINKAMGYLAVGNLDSEIDVEKLEGGYKELTDSVNDIIIALRTSMNRVKGAVEGLAHGDLDVDIDSSDMEGAYEELASQVNQSIFNVNMALSEIQELGQNLKNGNFNEVSEIGEEMPGIYGDIVGDINIAIEQISEKI